MPDKNNSPKKIDAKTKDAIILLVALVLCTVVVCGTYRLLIELPYFELVLFGYLAAETIMIAVYFIYNRGFSRKGITADMLPTEWSEEKKKDYIEDAKRRLHKSRWLLVVILAFLFTFALDVFELIVLPFIFDLIGI